MNNSEDWRHQCEVRYIARMAPDHRKAYLYGSENEKGVLTFRGLAATERLARDVAALLREQSSATFGKGSAMRMIQVMVPDAVGEAYDNALKRVQDIEGRAVAEYEFAEHLLRFGLNTVEAMGMENFVEKVENGRAPTV